MRRYHLLRPLAVAGLAAGLIAAATVPAGAATNHVKVLSWGSSGSGNGQFGEPTDVAVDGAGNVFVVDPINKKIQKFTPSGVFLTGFNKTCPIGGCFQTLAGPRSIAASGTTVWVADTAASQIVKYTSVGVFQLKVTSLSGSGPGAFGQPRGITVDANGRVYVVGSSGSAVHVFNPDGTVVGAFGTGASGSGFAVDVEGGTVYVATSDRLTRLSTAGAVLGSTSLSTYITEAPTGIAVDHTGHVLVTGRFQGFTWIGAYSPTFSSNAPPQVLNPPFGSLVLTAPKGLDADPTTGYVYVAESSLDRITKFGPPAALTLHFTGDGTDTPDRVFTLTADGQTTQTFVVDGDPASPEPSTVVTTVAPTTWNVALNQTNVQVKRITCSNGVGSDDYQATSVDLALLPGQSVSCEFYVEWIG